MLLPIVSYQSDDLSCVTKHNVSSLFIILLLSLTTSIVAIHNIHEDNEGFCL